MLMYDPQKEYSKDEEVFVVQALFEYSSTYHSDSKEWMAVADAIEDNLEHKSYFPVIYDALRKLMLYAYQKSNERYEKYSEGISMVNRVRGIYATQQGG